MATGGYDPKKDLGAQVRFLGHNLDKATTLLRHVDTQANILIGISTGLFVFTLSLSPQGLASQLSVYVLAIFSAATALAALFAVHPPRRLRKQGQKNSIMYHRKISSFGSSEKYGNTLVDLAGDQKSLTKEYAKEIYNIYRYTYQPKRTFFNLGRNLLIVGVLSSLVLYVVLRLVETTV